LSKDLEGIPFVSFANQSKLDHVSMRSQGNIFYPHFLPRYKDKAAHLSGRKSGRDYFLTFLRHSNRIIKNESVILSKHCPILSCGAKCNPLTQGRSQGGRVAKEVGRKTTT